MNPRIRPSRLAMQSLIAASLILLLISCSSPASPDVEDDPVPGELRGDPAAPAVTAIPALTFEPEEDSYTPNPAFGGLETSLNTVLVLLEPDGTTAEVNELLAQVGARIAGGVRTATDGMIVVRLESESHAELGDALLALRASAAVRLAVPDVRLGASRLPLRPELGGAPPEYSWIPITSLGTWGLSVTRVPEAWNTLGRLSLRPDARVTTGVLDGGFFAHQDLASATRLTPVVTGEHGTHVACTIGADFGNGLGVDGVSPVADLVLYGTKVLTLASVVDGLQALAAAGARVVNLSVNQDAAVVLADTAAVGALRSFGELFQVAHDGMDAGSGPPFLVTSAGNAESGLPADARFSGPPQWARLVLGSENILVVEALTISASGAERAASSNFGGDIAAPGVDILSCAGTEGYRFDEGTSFAAPYVTGLASYLLSVDPSLTNTDLIDLIVENGVPTGNPGSPTPFMDAFASVMDIDARKDEIEVLSLLLDIDDGSADGNLRLDWPETDDYRDADVDRDGGPGDGRVDMADFRRWRDWYHYTNETAGVDLDGSEEHPKLDVNGDSVLSGPVGEQIHARGDFNGDGVLDPVATAEVSRFWTDASDLDLLLAAFDDPDYDGDDVLDLIDSGDLHVHLDELAVDGRFAEVGSRVFDASATEDRVLDGDDPEEVYTVVPGSYDAAAWALDVPGDTVCLARRSNVDLEIGSDRHWQPTCGEPAVIEITLADQIEPGTASPLLIRAGAISEDGSTIYPEGSEILVEVFGGSVVDARGVTADDGYFDTEVVFGVGTLQLEVFVTVKVPVGIGENETRWDFAFARDTALALERAEVVLTSALFKVLAGTIDLDADSAAFPPTTSFSGAASSAACGASVDVSLSADTDMDGPDRMTGATVFARQTFHTATCNGGFPPAIRSAAFARYVFEVTAPVIATVTAEFEGSSRGVILGEGTDLSSVSALLRGSGAVQLSAGFYLFSVSPGGNGSVNARITFGPAPPPALSPGDAR